MTVLVKPSGIHEVVGAISVVGSTWTVVTGLVSV